MGPERAAMKPGRRAGGTDGATTFVPSAALPRPGLYSQLPDTHLKVLWLLPLPSGAPRGGAYTPGQLPLGRLASSVSR